MEKNMTKKIDDIMAMFFIIISLVLVPLNWLGTIVSGIWLAILGYWGVIGFGVITWIGATFLLSFPIVLAGLISAPGILLLDKKKYILASPFLAFGLLSTYGIIILWCAISFHIVLNYETGKNLFPLLIWAYGIATGPWSYMASKERDNAYSTLLAIFTQIGFLGSIISYGLFNLSFYNSILTLVIVLAFGMVFQLTIIYLENTKQKQLNF
jgi:hypothetical protein